MSDRRGGEGRSPDARPSPDVRAVSEHAAEHTWEDDGYEGVRFVDPRDPWCSSASTERTMVLTDDQIRDVMTRALEYGASEPIEVARLVVDEFIGEAEIAELVREHPGMTEEQALNGVLHDVALRVARIDGLDRRGPPSPPARPPM
jgi:hypothetical protein